MVKQLTAKYKKAGHTFTYSENQGIGTATVTTKDNELVDWWEMPVTSEDGRIAFLKYILSEGKNASLTEIHLEEFIN